MISGGNTRTEELDAIMDSRVVPLQQYCRIAGLRPGKISPPKFLVPCVNLAALWYRKEDTAAVCNWIGDRK